MCVCVLVIPVFLKLTNVTLQNEPVGFSLDFLDFWFTDLSTMVYFKRYRFVTTLAYKSAILCERALHANSIWSTLHATWQFRAVYKQSCSSWNDLHTAFSNYHAHTPSVMHFSAFIQTTISKPDTFTTDELLSHAGGCTHSSHRIHYNSRSNIAEEIQFPGILKDPTQQKPELKLFFFLYHSIRINTV